MSDPVVVLAVFEPAEGKYEELKAALQGAIPAVHAEPGCELYAIHDGEDGTIYMIEKWTTVADLDAHGAGDPVKALGAAIEGLRAGGSVTRMFPIPAGVDTAGLL